MIWIYCMTVILLQWNVEGIYELTQQDALP
jgi:hypothetical protein